MCYKHSCVFTLLQYLHKIELNKSLKSTEKDNWNSNHWAFFTSRFYVDPFNTF